MRNFVQDLSMTQGSDDAMVTVNIQRAYDYFSPRPRLYGDTHLTVDWGTASSQAKRFQVLSNLTEINDSSILDVGCGVGHLIDWLDANSFKNYLYQGIDIVPEMIEMAKSRHPSHKFCVCDLLSEDKQSLSSYDIVFASGIFYLANERPYDFMAIMLKKLFSLSSKVLVFNLLTNTCTQASPLDEMNACEFRADMSAVVQIVESLTPLYRIEHAYHPGDATISLYPVGE